MADSPSTPPASAASTAKGRIPASDSTDPAVHQLLAQLDIARRNLAAGQQATDDAAERASDINKVIDDLKKQIRDLGCDVD